MGWVRDERRRWRGWFLVTVVAGGSGVASTSGVLPLRYVLRVRGRDVPVLVGDVDVGGVHVFWDLERDAGGLVVVLKVNPKLSRRDVVPEFVVPVRVVG